ncbi:MAG: hypothetical protein EOO05_01735 [Chitinophagaceae bacterium]|nr:MAG: hypothetical protein EOO05_01735 [Chitinophagaceae bacterium]
MNKIKFILLLAILVSIIPDLHAQRKVLGPNRGKKTAKDSLVLGCVLRGQVFAPDDDELNVVGEKELKAVMSSETDTTVRAPWDLTVSSVKRLEDGTFEMVASHQDYWFWFTGIEKTKLYKGQVLKTGDAIGYLETGKKIELLLYDFETPLDPRKYITCK